MSNDSTPNSTNTPKASDFGWKLPLACVLVFILGISGVAAWKAWPQTNRYYTDGDELRVDAEDARVRDVLWREPQPLPATINLDGDDYEPQFDESARALYFVRGKTGDNADIFVAHRTDEGWSPPVALDAINTEYDELGPRLSRDGLTLYFYSDRPGGFGGYDLWVARRTSRDIPFDEPTNLGPHVNSSWDEYSPAPTPSGDKIYFASNRPVGELKELPKPKWSATLRENRRRTGYDLYLASVTGAGISDAQPLDALNSSDDEGTPTVSPNGDFVYFSSNRSGGAGGFDLYRSRVGPSGFGEIEWLGRSVNGPADDLDPVLSMEGFELLFSSNRSAGGLEASSSSREPTYDIYRTSSREVFVAAEVLDSEFNWAAMLRVLGPGLLALLLLLLLLLLSRMLLSSKWRGRLSLIMRCLLASLLVHVLLLTLFMFWQVKTSLSDLFDRDGGVRVALAAPAGDSGIAAQIRGGFAEATLPTVQPTISARMLEHKIVPARLAASSVSLPRSIVDAPQGESPRSDIADTVPTPNRNVLRPASLNPQALPQPNALELNAPKTRQPQRISEAVAALPLVKTDPADVPRAVPTHGIAKPQLTELSNSVVPMQLPSDAMNRVEPESMPINDAASPSTQFPKSARTVELPTHTFADITLPQPNRRQPKVIERDMPIPAVDSAMPSRASLDPNPNAKPLELAAGEIQSKPIELPHVETQSDNVADHMPDAHANLITTNARVEIRFSPEESEFELPQVSSRSVHATGEAQNALPVLTEGGVTRPALQLAVPDATPLPTSRSLPGLSQAIRVDGLNDHANQSAIRDADVNARHRTRVQPVHVNALDLAEFDLAPPTIPKPAKPIPVTNAIGGQVTDAHTGEPIEGAVVRLDLSDVDTETAPTDTDGAYALHIPHVPDHFAISTSFEGYVPASVNIAKESVRERSLTVNFKLRRIDLSTVALEAVPDVHHLGDGRFSGSVNSQFQKRSEGGTYVAAFEVSDLQLPPHMTRCELTMLTRGVQMPHSIYINNRRTPLRMTNSPRDGSFGLYKAEIDIRWLSAGENTFGIKARSRGDDIDDFEFVNIQMHFLP